MAARVVVTRRWRVIIARCRLPASASLDRWAAGLHDPYDEMPPARRDPGAAATALGSDAAPCVHQLPGDGSCCVRLRASLRARGEENEDAPARTAAFGRRTPARRTRRRLYPADRRLVLCTSVLASPALGPCIASWGRSSSRTAWPRGREGRRHRVRRAGNRTRTGDLLLTPGRSRRDHRYGRRSAGSTIAVPMGAGLPNGDRGPADR